VLAESAIGCFQRNPGVEGATRVFHYGLSVRALAGRERRVHQAVDRPILAMLRRAFALTQGSTTRHLPAGGRYLSIDL